MVQTSTLFLSYCEPICPIFTTANSLYPGCTSPVMLLYTKKQGFDSMHLYEIFSSFHRRLEVLFSVQCARHMAVILWIKWNMNVINFISIPTSQWSLHFVSTAPNPSLCKCKLCVLEIQFYKKVLCYLHYHFPTQRDFHHCLETVYSV